MKLRDAHKKIIIRDLVVLVVFYFGFAAFITWAMRQPPETFARVMSHMPGPVVFLAFPFETFWTHTRAGELRPGDPAPDFSLVKLDKSGRVQLSALTAQQ